MPSSRLSRRVYQSLCVLVLHTSNDPSAGSPTETLLRLLLPLSAPVRTSFRRITLARRQRPPIQGSHWYTQSVVATGGVYKGQGLSHGRLSDLPLLGIPSLWGTIASPRPKHATHTRGAIILEGFQRVARCSRSRKRTCCARHCSARAAQSI